MSSGQIALLISFGSLLVAAISLGWNVYRDVIRKPKLVIKLMVGAIIFAGDFVIVVGPVTRRARSYVAMREG